MRKKQQLNQIFLFCIILALFALIISPLMPARLFSGVIEKLLAPLQKSIYSNLGLSFTQEKDEVVRLTEEILRLEGQLASSKLMEADLSALRSQFAESPVLVKNLIPGQIIGMNAMFPKALPTQITINIGKSQGIKKGMAVIYRNILIGSITDIAHERSVVSLLNHENTVLKAKTLKTSASGILKGEKNNILLSDVLLSEKLETGDVVVTSGDQDLQGSAIPPDLVIGKIHKVNKKPSALFQSASIASLLNVTKLALVFVIIN